MSRAKDLLANRHTQEMIRILLADQNCGNSECFRPLIIIDK